MSDEFDVVVQKALDHRIALDRHMAKCDPSKILRLECLKLAIKDYGGTPVDGVLKYAEALYGFVDGKPTSDA